MRTDSENTTLSRVKECPVTVIHNSRRILDVKIIQHAEGVVASKSAPILARSAPSAPDNIHHAGTAGHPSVLSSTTPLVSLNPSCGGPAPDHLLHRLWKHSPYCPESPKHGIIRRVNGRWVHEKGRGR